MITEDYCSYEVSKLLKGKGFNVPCLAHWHIGNDGHEKFSDYPFNWNEKVKNDLGWLSCPTHQMAMKWLREICKLSIEPYVIATEENCIGYAYAICSCKTSLEIFAERWDGKNPFASYEEAVEAALKYSLENLILL